MHEVIGEIVKPEMPLPWRSILAFTDFSDASGRALQAALYLAGQCQAKITFLCVVQLSASNSLEAGLAVDEIVSSSRASLDEFANGCPDALVGSKVVRLATQGLVLEVVDAAHEVSADLIVVASHGFGFLKRLWVGASVEELVKHAPCAVLVVGPAQNHRPLRSTAPGSGPAGASKSLP